GIVRALALHRPVDVLYARFGALSPAPEYERAPGVAFHAVTPSRGAGRAIAYARARAAGTPGGWARSVSAELTREAVRLAGAPGRGRVIADGPEAAVALRALARRRAVIYNAHNVESSFREQIGGLGSARRLEAFERRLLQRFAESWMVSHRDMELARTIAPGRPLRYVPNVVDVAAIDPVAPDREANRILFVADFRYPPNQEGLAFLLDEVMPRVWGEMPDAALRLAGRGLDGPPSADERVEALGFVDDLRDAYVGATCAVVPLLLGGGSPLKFVEALAYGLPVVATPVAAAGLEIGDGEHYRRAEGAEGFAVALVAELRGGDEAMGTRGRAHAQAEYSIEALARRL
ncbi:MAG: glycosyltransferase, partial [Solirubrobacteraceae bacterium]